MKIFLLSLILLGGCDTITRKHSDGKIDSIRVIQSEVGGLIGLVSGKSSTCTIVSSEENPIEVEEMIFDASANTCTAKVKSK